MSKRPKILYIQKPPGGGSAVALYDMVKALDQQKFEPIILCFELNEYTSVLNELGVKVLFLSARKHNQHLTVKQKIPIKFFAPFRKLKRLIIDDRRKSKQIAAIIKENHIDLIHHNSDINDCRPAILANRKTRLPQVCHYRSLKPYYNDPVNWNIDYFMAKNINFHIYISKAVERHFSRHLKIKGSSGMVIRDIVDPKKFEPLAKTTRLVCEFGFSDKDIIITNIARISRWKGQHIFLKAIAEVRKLYPNVKALVVGPSETGVGDPVYMEELKKLSHHLGINGAVIFTGNRNDIPEILSITDIVTHTSIEPEPQGLVIIEALLAGKPIIVSDAGGAAELIVNDQGGCKIEPGSVAELSIAIKRYVRKLMKHEDVLSNRDKPEILAEFNTALQIKTIEDIYERLLN